MAKRITIYLSDEEYENLRWLAYKRHEKMAAIIREALKKFIAQDKTQPGKRE